MEHAELIGRLAAHATIGHVPREELAWLAEHGTVRHLERGDVLTARDRGQVEALYVVLSGQIGMFVPRVNGREKIIEWRGGDVSGVLPYSRMGAPPGDAIAEQPSDVLAVPRHLMPELARDCPELTAALVHVMVDRARLFTSSDLAAEKMVSLGKLSAGLAHELNNPASAVTRNARTLRDAIEASERASRALGALRLGDDQLATIADLHRQCVASPVTGVRSPLQQADREDAFSDWLEARGVDPREATALADTSVELPMLERLTEVLDPPALAVVLKWVAAACATRHLAGDIEQAAVRISELVDAIKGFTHMDQTPTAGPVHLATDLTQTLVMLRAKARAKSASIDVRLEPGLPPAHGYAGELNQIWVNLIDNALDAVPVSGRVVVSAAAEGDRVVVRVTDNGPGIPPDVLRRIFEPFFTTKPVGQGTGLGLDIVNRIVRKHEGQITVDSRPGRTEFSVTLPMHSDAHAEPRS